VAQTELQIGPAAADKKLLRQEKDKNNQVSAQKCDSKIKHSAALMRHAELNPNERTSSGA
jgi:hypothetical protein